MFPTGVLVKTDYVNYQYYQYLLLVLYIIYQYYILPVQSMYSNVYTNVQYCTVMYSDAQ